MPSTFHDADWNVMRLYIYWLLKDADGKITLPLGSRAPKTISDVQFLLQGWTFEFRLDETLRLTASALKDAGGALTQAHRVAATVQINAPTHDDATQLAADLKDLSAFVRRDERARALSSFFASASDVIRGMNAAA